MPKTKTLSKRAKISPAKRKASEKAVVPSRAVETIKSQVKKNNKQQSNATDTAFPIVGVGASAGGLEAFTRLLKQLPPDTGMSFVLVQHLDPLHKSALTNLLSKVTTMPVREVTNNARVKPNLVYVIPPNASLAISEGILKLSPRKKSDGQHRPIDHFYQSLAEDQGARAISVILSGTASDGTLGCEAIKAEGGITFAQDQSAKYDSMPRSAVAAGCIDFVLSPEGIAKELARIARHPYVHSDLDDEPISLKDVEEGARELTEHPGRTIPGNKEDPFRKILLLLRNNTGVDFSLYKPSTIKRRIGRRLLLSQLKSLDAYLRFLKNNPKECETLYQDMLISVTGFFRNPGAFDVIKNNVFPKLLKNRSPDDSVRIWVLGCSTGQEAYSIAMAFLEVTARTNSNVPLQVFATDLNESLLVKARAGLYTKTLVSELSPERLGRFFVEEDGGYRISKSIREMCVFAQQNLLSDPPFSRMNLISCRNLLIYLDPGSHQKILPTLHYALKPQGYLFLGASETVGSHADLFAPVDKKHRIYVKKPASTRPHNLAVPVSYPVRERIGGSLALLTTRESSDLEAQREADRITLNKYGPAGVLVNANLDILQFRGVTSPYLAPAPGRASFNLLKMARDGLLFPLRTALNKARKENQKVRKQDVRIDQNGRSKFVNIEVLPLKNLKEQCYLVLFESPQPGSARMEATKENPKRKSGKNAAGTEDQAREIVDLKRELSEMRDYLQSVLEEHEAANEELQASNEEVQSANEELQSINEELETSKEELESTNEELITVNEEMQNRNRELDRANSDLNNLYASMNLSVVLLARDLTIRRFTPRAEKELKLLANDIGQPLNRLKTSLELPNLETVALEVVKTAKTYETEIQDKHGRWYSLRVSPYMTLDNKIDGAVLVLVDVDELKRAEETSSHFAALVQTSDDAIISKTLEGIILTWNDGAEGMFGYTAEEVVGQPIHVLLPADRIEEEPMILDAIKRGESIDHLETVRIRQDGTTINTLLTVSPIRDKDGKITGASTIAHDITESKLAEEELQELLIGEQEARADAQAANRVKDEFLAMVSHELRTPLNSITGWAQLLAKGNLDADTTQRAVTSIVRNAAAQAIIINDLLDTARIMSGKLQLDRKPVNVTEVVNSAVEAVRGDAARKSIELVLDLEPAASGIEGDARRLEQAVGNILSNAVKFTPESGKVEVQLSRVEDDVRLIVKDNGKGINPEFLPYLFDRFKQADASEKRIEGGLGLGLSIARQLVERHGGSIKGESAGEGRGSAFTICLPLMNARHSGELENQSATEPKAEAIHPVQMSHNIFAGLRILVVEDQPDTRDLLTFALSQYGAEVKTCSSASDAFQLVRQWKPGLIVSDIGLPSENGYELMKKVRGLKSAEGGRVPAMALTGYASGADESKALEAGYQAHMAKPVDLQELVRTIARLSGYPRKSRN